MRELLQDFVTFRRRSILHRGSSARSSAEQQSKGKNWLESQGAIHSGESRVSALERELALNLVPATRPRSIQVPGAGALLFDAGSQYPVRHTIVQLEAPAFAPESKGEALARLRLPLQ